MFKIIFTIVGITCLSCFFYCCEQPKSESQEKTEINDEFIPLYIGTYTRKEGHVDGKAEGILVYKMNKKTGELQYKTEYKGSINPSYLALHPNRKYLYAVNEIGESDGTISAFRIEKDSLVFLNMVSAEGAAPCHLSVDPTGKYVFVANYVGGNIGMFPIEENGELKEAVALINHKGKGKHPRQETPHAHYIAASPDGKFAYAVDLGLDKIFIYQLDTVDGGMLQKDVFAETNAGAGPRHLTFHPFQDWVYVINELNGSVDAFLRDTLNGQLAHFQTVKTFEEHDKVNAACAAIHCHPNGKFLYISNRGSENDIAIFEINNENGDLTKIGHQSTKGDAPRDFAIDPTGKFLFAANQNSSTVATFKIDSKTGLIVDTGRLTEIPTPVCLKFGE